MQFKFLRKLLAVLVLMSVAGSVRMLAQSAISGKVFSPDNEPLIGVSIRLKGASVGTTTDIDGNFKLSASPADVLVFSYTGFLTQDVPVEGNTVFNIILKENLSQLDEVVVIGYGQVKRSNVVGAISSIKAEELKKVPTTNVMESLQGRLPGVDITRTSGAAGAGINVLVRGNRSLTASNSPLFIVDGIQYNSIQDLNPNDIQSMEVLKDAASTAIYGSRGANGVILITTKKGAAGKTKISFNTYFGSSELYGYPKVFSAEEYKQNRREANRTTGNWTSSADDSKIFGNLLNSPGTVWPDQFLQNGSQQDYQLGISSGTEKTNFYASLDYFKENGLFARDVLKRYSIRLNVDHSINKMFKIGTQNQVTFYNQDIRQDPLVTANKLVPLEVPYDSTGKIVEWLNNNRNVNPLLDENPENWTNNNRTSRVFTSAFVEFKPIDHVTFRSNLGAEITNSRDGMYAASLSVFRAGAKAFARYSNGQNLGLNLENVLSYDNSFGKHSLNLTAVHSVLKNRREEVTAQGTNQLLAYQLFYGLANANEEVSIGSNFVESRLLSYTGRVQYGFDDKYLLMLTGRRDGASQLGEGKKWAFFPSVAAAWRITQEGFMENVSMISDLKLRASYGVAGNSAVLPYSTQSYLVRVPFAFDETPAIGYAFGSRLGNPDLEWEISTTANLGLDFGLWQGRLSGTLDVFKTQTENLLLERLLPLSSGFSRVIENIGKTETQGIELGLNAVAVSTRNITWNVGLNWFKTKEKIVELATSSNDVANGWFIGESTQSFFDYEKVGIWQENEVDAAKTFNQVPGDIKVKDQNGDGKIDATNDRIIIGSGRPDWIGSLNSDFRFKNFDFGFQIFARWGQMMNYEMAGIYDPQANENSLKHNYWTPENPGNDYPRPNSNRSKSATLYFSTLQYRDASFAKLRSMTLGYTFPKTWTDRVKIGKCRIYATGRNLFVQSKVDDYDPERGGSQTYPMSRLFVGGVNLDF